MKKLINIVKTFDESVADMKLLFKNENTFMSAATRFFTFGRWSHVAVMDGAEIIEAVTSGVRVNTWDNVIDEASDYSIVNFPLADETAFIKAVRSQVGKPYDTTAVLGMVLRRNWQDEDKWFCSELPAWAAEKTGQPFFRSDAMHRVTPEHWWMLNPKRSTL